MNTLNNIFVVWTILGILLTFFQIDRWVRFYIKIKTKSKKLIFILLLSFLGGPVAILLVLIAILTLGLVELILEPIGTQFEKYIITPIANWLQK